MESLFESDLLDCKGSTTKGFFGLIEPYSLPLNTVRESKIRAPRIIILLLRYTIFRIVMLVDIHSEINLYPYPPPITRFTPVRYLDSSCNKKTTALDMSSTLANLF